MPLPLENLVLIDATLSNALAPVRAPQLVLNAVLARRAGLIAEPIAERVDHAVPTVVEIIHHRVRPQSLCQGMVSQPTQKGHCVERGQAEPFIDI
jgi:hypothetical protein